MGDFIKIKEIKNGFIIYEGITDIGYYVNDRAQLLKKLNRILDEKEEAERSLSNG